jgi:hypothetical protein
MFTMIFAISIACAAYVFCVVAQPFEHCFDVFCSYWGNAIAIRRTRFDSFLSLSPPAYFATSQAILA